VKILVKDPVLCNYVLPPFGILLSDLFNKMSMILINLPAVDMPVTGIFSLFTAPQKTEADQHTDKPSKVRGNSRQ
jgi:hypothetical protein